MKTRDINTRASARTSDMTPEAGSVTSYNFPSLGVIVEAASYDEALVKAKEAYKVANK